MILNQSLTPPTAHNIAKEARAAELVPWPSELILHKEHSKTPEGDRLVNGYTFDPQKFSRNDYDKVQGCIQSAATAAGLRIYFSGKEHPTDRLPSVIAYCSSKSSSASSSSTAKTPASSAAVYQVRDSPRDGEDFLRAVTCSNTTKQKPNGDVKCQFCGSFPNLTDKRGQPLSFVRMFRCDRCEYRVCGRCY